MEFDEIRGWRRFFDFSLIEGIHLAIATLVLASFYAIATSEGGLFAVDVSEVVSALPLAAVAVVPAFLLHELAHKFMAIRYDMWARFELQPAGLAIGVVILALAHVVAAAPGYVSIRGHISRSGSKEMLDEALRAQAEAKAEADRREAGEFVSEARQELKEAERLEGHIGIVGPIVNIVLACAFLLLEAFLRSSGGSRTALGDLNFWDQAVLLNIALAGMNMLPIGPLDGRKVWFWSKLAFVGMWLAVIGLGLSMAQLLL